MMLHLEKADFMPGKGRQMETLDRSQVDDRWWSHQNGQESVLKACEIDQSKD